VNRAQALREAARRWGDNAAVEDKGKARATTPESRAQASAERTALRAKIDAENRRPTPEEKLELNRLFSDGVRQRFCVGVIATLGPFRAFRIQGVGDSWAECFAQVDQREAEIMNKLSSAQAQLLEALQRGTTLRVERMSGRHKAQSRVYRDDTGEDVTSVANTLRERGFVRVDYTLAKSGRKITT
jgi:hypothetical protein